MAPMTLPLSHPLRLAAAALLCAAPALAAGAPAGTQATLAILETTDVHANVVGYDYFKLAADPSFGLDRTATLIAAARREFANTLLFDNGDTIQGTALGDYQALVNPVRCGDLPGIYKVMKALGYDGGGIGNHDFNYGLGFLGQVTGQRFDVAGVRQDRPAPAPVSRRCWPTSTASRPASRCSRPTPSSKSGYGRRMPTAIRSRRPSRWASSALRRRRSWTGTSAGWRARSTPRAWSKRPGATSRRCARRVPTWSSRSRTAAWMARRIRRRWKTPITGWRRCPASMRC